MCEGVLASQTLIARIVWKEIQLFFGTNKSGVATQMEAWSQVYEYLGGHSGDKGSAAPRAGRGVGRGVDVRTGARECSGSWCKRIDRIEPGLVAGGGGTRLTRHQTLVALPRRETAPVRSSPSRLSHSTINHLHSPHKMEMKRWWWIAGGFLLLSLAAVSADGEVWEESEHEVLIRSARGAKNRETCRYVRGSWSECDSKTNVRFRKLTLKKGNPANCETIKTIQKKCKKACRYEKSAWSECSANGEMSRTDVLKPNSDPTCEKSKRATKKCNKNKQAKSAKDKARRNRQ